jgi:hypothetical protein
MAKQQHHTFLKVENTLLAATGPDKPLVERRAECVQRFIDLGLGRGLDATSSKPWLQKSSFQVREVTYDSIVGTEEGGAVEAYENLVVSVQTLQLSLKASITAPTNTGPVKIGMDSEHSRTVSTTRRVVGRRVQNRTIAFKESFDDIPLETALKPSEVQHTLGSKQMDDTHTGLSPSKRKYTFDERLCEWVLENMNNDHPHICSDDYIESMRSGTSPSRVFEEWFRKQSAGDPGQLVWVLQRYCESFVGYFHITHYVSSIQLGALEYRVMSEQEYYRSINQSGSLGFDSIATAAVKGGYSWKRTSKSTHVKCIGAIQEEDADKGYLSVPRGTYGESVIEAEFKPVTTLVRSSRLRYALQRAVTKYIEGKADSSGEWVW